MCTCVTMFISASAGKEKRSMDGEAAGFMRLPDTGKAVGTKKKMTRYFDAAEDSGKTEEFTPDLSRFSQRKRDKTLSSIANKNITTIALSRNMTLKKNEVTGWDKLVIKGDDDDRDLPYGRNVRKQPRGNDPFPGDAPVPKDKIKKYTRGDKMHTDGIKTKYQQHHLQRRDRKLRKAAKQAARSEFLLPQTTGFLEADEGELTTEVTQHDIARAVDVFSAQKYFELELNQFGPYRMDYTRNGRHLLIGGRRGHIAAFDWQTKKLHCEINVMETVQDVKWLHIETMFAVAQKQWTYIYDNQGVELHCLKKLDSVLRMEFLPYHFLLVAANAKGYLSYTDVSIGQKVAGYMTSLGRLDVMCQNPRNAIIHLGHSGGTVTMWSPNVKEPLVKMLCHGGGTRSIDVDKTGQYMATSGIDRTLKIWDLRTYKMLQSYKIGAGAGELNFSQRGLLAASLGNTVEVYKDCVTETMTSPYMSHKCREPISGLQFCPYEDVLGVTHGKGLDSLLIPGAGESNYDALAANPYQTKSQRRQAEVKMLLEKIQPDLISLDSGMLGKIDTKTLQETIEEKNRLLFLKPQKVEFEPKYKKKGRSKAGRVEKRKQGVQLESKREYIREMMELKQQQEGSKKDGQSKKPKSVLDRFKRTDS